MTNDLGKFINVTPELKEDYNKVVIHPLQSFEWGEFRKKTDVKVIRRALVANNKIVDGFTLTLHKVPKLPYNIGYLPKGNLPTKELLKELYRIGKVNNCVYIQIEPNISRNHELGIRNYEKEERLNTLIHDSLFIIRPSFHPLFTRYTFIVDLTKSEEELLKSMHPKTRYNIKVAQKHGVEIVEDNSDKAFETYLKLTAETTKRQKFYAHDEEYHKKMWKTIGIKNQELGIKDKKSRKNKNPDSVFMIHNSNRLTAHLLIAKYKNKILVTWILFKFHDTLYYPYGASSSLYRETMASNLIMWEAIRLGKKLGLKKFDMWGSLGPNPNTHDPWYGFHRFKEGYGATLIEFAGSFDLIINPSMYHVLRIADKARWAFLKLKLSL